MYLSSPQNNSPSAGSPLFTRRRLKAVLPILIGLILVPFFVSTFYGGEDGQRNLLARARRLYNKGDEAQSTLRDHSADIDSSHNDADREPANVHISDHLNGVLHRPAGHLEHSGYGAEEHDLTEDLLDYDSKGFDEDTVDGDDEELDPELLEYDQVNSEYEVGPPMPDYLDYSIKPSNPAQKTQDFLDSEGEDVTTIPDRGDYRELFSLTSKDRRFMSIFFEGAGITNPGLIPHPMKSDLWVVLAQRVPSLGDASESRQAYCTAGFLEDVLICDDAFANLTMSSFVQGACEGDLEYLNDQSGARDARLFYGNDAPYVIYGSQAQHTCIGMWLQDARTLLEPFHLQVPLARFFSHATELQRPPPYRDIEKDYLIFWDAEGKAYVQYELWPKRSFAQLDIDGSVGDDLDPAASHKDQVCMARFAPRVNPAHESLQQGSNSLAITLCKRLDPKCKPNESNTFIMHMIYHNFDYDSHAILEPHLVLFQQSAPFALHAISQRPFWIHGRQALTNDTGSPQYQDDPDEIPDGHTERFTIPSISWKNHVQKYHGYIDDVLLLGIGIEDGRAGVMDVTAGDLVQDLAYC